MAINLYDYQDKCLDEVRGAYRQRARAPLLVAPTGSGKTIMFSAICKSAVELKGNRVMILVHRQELIQQVSDTLGAFDVKHGIISPQYAPAAGSNVQVASVFSVSRRGAGFDPDLIIIDEAHHATLRSTWGKVISAHPKARLLGVSATPTRLSGEGLGDIFDRIILGPTTAQLIEAGRLSAVKVFAPPTISTEGLHTKMGEFVRSEISERVDKPKVTGDAIEHYKSITPGQRAAVFCVSIEHARHMQAAAAAAGITAVQIDGQMDRHLRMEVIRDFKMGKIQWLVTVDLISEGFDCPGIEVGICLRPTQSLALWLQQCGRCLRTSPGKSHATILDHAGNALRHGLPTEERHWSLAGEARASKSAQSPSVRVCIKCYTAQRSGRSSCGNCGLVFTIESRTVESAKGTLEELTPQAIAARRARQEVGQTKTLEALTQLARIRGYNAPERWASYVYAGRQAKRTAK